MNGETPEAQEGIARMAREALDPGHVSGRNPERAARGDEPSGLSGRNYSRERAEFRRASRRGARE
jgi:hypothetical protein